MIKYKTIAIDYDGTLVQDSLVEDTDSPIIPGADKITQRLRDEGWEILIFTCRPSFQRKAIEENLRRQGVHFEHISFYGKPNAAVYVDNRGFRFEGNWNETYNWLVENLKNEDDVDSGN